MFCVLLGGMIGQREYLVREVVPVVLMQERAVVGQRGLLVFVLFHDGWQVVECVKGIDL
jgi:hypothetical protein